jgi:hypothetical protein
VAMARSRDGNGLTYKELSVSYLFQGRRPVFLTIYFHAIPARALPENPVRVSHAKETPRQKHT